MWWISRHHAYQMTLLKSNVIGSLNVGDIVRPTHGSDSNPLGKLDRCCLVSDTLIENQWDERILPRSGIKNQICQKLVTVKCVRNEGVWIEFLQQGDQVFTETLQQRKELQKWLDSLQITFFKVHFINHMCSGTWAVITMNRVSTSIRWPVRWRCPSRWWPKYTVHAVLW